jgi:GT2 family glycosyltransferase
LFVSQERGEGFEHVGGVPTVGLIIVGYNGGELLLDAIRSATGQTAPPHRVVVIDNASTDGSAERVAEVFPRVELVRMEENVGFAAANNVGIAMLDDCEYVGLLNPDAYADPGWLESLLAAAAANPGYASFASTIERADGSGRLDSAGDVYHVYGTAWPGRRGACARTEPKLREIFGPSGAAALYRREWLVRVGGFDERYFCYFEDVDLNLRIQVAGGRSLFVPEARVRHVGGTSSDGRGEFSIYHSQRNLVWTFVKSAPPHVFWRYLPAHLLLNVGSIATYAAHGHTRTLLRAKRDALLGLPAMLRARRRVMRSRAFDRPAFDGVMRSGPLVLLRETRP